MVGAKHSWDGARAGGYEGVGAKHPRNGTRHPVSETRGVRAPRVLRPYGMGSNLAVKCRNNSGSYVKRYPCRVSRRRWMRERTSTT